MSENATVVLDPCMFLLYPTPDLWTSISQIREMATDSWRTSAAVSPETGHLNCPKGCQGHSSE